MRGKILVMLVLAVVCGGASLVAARSWLDGQASQRMAAIKAEAPTVSFATLVVAAEPLRFGAPLSRKNLKTIPWPDAELPQGAFRSIDDLVSGEPRTVLFPLEASEPVLAAKITGPGERAGLSRLIAEGHRAVTIRVNDVAGVAGFVLPGDRVDVVLTVQKRDVLTNDVLLQSVKVLSIDQIADERASDPVVAKAVTVEVDPTGAQKISLAQSLGTLSLSLRGSGDVDPATVETLTAADVTGLGRASAAALAAAQPSPAAPMAQTKPVDTAVSVSVVRMLVSTDYRVPARGPVDARDAGTVAPPAVQSVPPPAPVPMAAAATPATVEPTVVRTEAVPVAAPSGLRPVPRPPIAAAVAPHASLAALSDRDLSTGSLAPAAAPLPGGGHILDLPTR